MNKLLPCLLLISLPLITLGCSKEPATPSPASATALAPSSPPATQATSPPVSRWEPAISAFEEADVADPPQPGGIVFIGSSSIRGWRTLEEDFPGHNVINRGFGGSRIADSVEFLDRILLPYKPAKVVLYAGDNDVNGGMEPEAVFEDFRTFATRIHEELPDTEIIFISIKPSPARWQQQERFTTTNRLVEQYAGTDDRTTYVDIVTPMLDEKGQPRPELYQADKLHLTPAGYDVWTRTLKPYLDE